MNLVVGTISFGPECRWHAQLLGTESEASGTWLWAWANDASNIPAYLLTASLTLKSYGEQHGIPELTTPQLPLDQVDPHALALLASGACQANAYYRCPYEGGALYVLIMDENFPKCTDPPLQRIATVFPQAIASLDIPDHEEALCGYLDHYDLGHEHTGNQIIVQDKSGEPVLTATFDARKRLTSLEVKLDAQADGPGEGTAAAGKRPENSPDEGGAPGRPPDDNWDRGQLRRMLGG